MDETGFVMCGALVHSTDAEPLEIMQHKCIGVKEGKIVFIENEDALSEKIKEFGIPQTDITYLKKGQFLCPGFVDTHLHAPQYPNCGKGLDMGLLDWLQTYTFPTEAKFSDLKYADMVYRKAVRRVLRNGTTTGCYFATLHTDATLLLCDVINEYGQRAYVGKVNMNIGSPDFYIESSVEESLSETKRYIEEVKKRNYPHITPIVTPRFALSCCQELMSKLGDLAKAYDLPIQTHICETRDEVRIVGETFPGCESYAAVYDKAGLLTDKMVLAHGIYLSDNEIALIKARNSAISHCPNSNFSIRSGVLDLRRLEEARIKVGLGTDISGGYHPSMLNAIRTAVFVSNIHHIEAEHANYKALSVHEAFRLATLGGAKALGLDNRIGNFAVGKDFDALLIDPSADGSHVDVLPDDSFSDSVDKYLYNGDDRNILSIYVAGRKVIS
ncbi:guanine deaminase-like [Mya arenaria]|uniref:guanine deaminase-like n=1 Tax=Mya arenaria TaxID=6604 RepID=UPI0022E3666B|nr:guanine deaminase-like [Mya arenaria]XP_052784468.1 guanine deaminase-like [Mya arenaria]XP_052784469.1 guanine deaminase-like [Mya arenaria]XP_052784470.1 guanine deaminase-like [Mya arenaria]XP_052784471.1 guanine deaminase-like [Mya arenaria]